MIAYSSIVPSKMLAKIRVVRRWSDRQRSRPDRLVGPESLILSPEKMQATDKQAKDVTERHVS